jgi:hypothetical protein
MSDTTKHADIYKNAINTRVSDDMKKGIKEVAKKSKRKASDYTRLLFQFAIDNDLEL